MRRLLRNRLLLQLLFTLVAALCVAAVSILLITKAISSAERVVVAETRKTLSAAMAELVEQYKYRASSDSTWTSLPEEARDVSLRGITQTVLRSYPGVEGGFYSDGQFLGYAFPTHDTGLSKTDVPGAERDLIISVNQSGNAAHGAASQLVRGKTDLLVLAAVPISGAQIEVWTMKRLPNRNVAGTGKPDLLLLSLILATAISIAGTLATGLALARGVTQIQQGLARLEKEFEYRLPERSDELGGISRSINRMAQVRRKLEIELRREDRLRALGRLAAGLAHEIKNPLNSISLTAQLLERRSDTSSAARADLETMRSEVERLSTLLDQLLDLQRSREPDPQTQPVIPVLRHCIGLVGQQAQMQDASIVLEAADDQFQARFDSRQLTQTVVNLLLNALEASPRGATVIVNAAHNHSVARVEIADQGLGLNEEQQEHLFEPFYTTKAVGTGLGLAVSRELMRSQGGDLRLAASETGARFVIELPRN